MNPTSGYILHQTFARPKTRGELCDRINAGEICEVVADNEEITSLLIRSWLKVAPFTTCPSPNEGWALYCPAPKEECFIVDYAALPCKVGA